MSYHALAGEDWLKSLPPSPVTVKWQEAWKKEDKKWAFTAQRYGVMKAWEEKNFPTAKAENEAFHYARTPAGKAAIAAQECITNFTKTAQGVEFVSANGAMVVSGRVGTDPVYQRMANDVAKKGCAAAQRGWAASSNANTERTKQTVGVEDVSAAKAAYETALANAVAAGIPQVALLSKCPVGGVVDKNGKVILTVKGYEGAIRCINKMLGAPEESGLPSGSGPGLPFNWKLVAAAGALLVGTMVLTKRKK